jgi:predicted nucleic acid-binding protein
VILVDASVWINHLRKGDPALEGMLSQGRVLTHPFVIGELALGQLRRRDVVLDALQSLPRVIVAREEEVLRFIEGQPLFGKGIGYVDAHLLTAVVLTPGTLLWTRDQSLRAAADRLSIHVDFR